MNAGAVAVTSPFRQPKAVWAVAFACVVSFMGIGLVDPILPALSEELNASPSQVTLLFTSYLVVTAVAMLVTNWVSSRIGAKRTLISGLVLIVVFAAAAGASDTIGGIVGFRAGWGLGNALFIATSLAVIVASASGGFAGAIILYETALGLGIAVGPLLGGTLGAISWRGPFFGVSVLMAIALIATLVLLEPTPKPDHRTSLAAPIKALRHRGLLIMSLTAVCYNWGFFTLLGYAPFPMHLGIHQLGLVFTGWGIMVAIFSVFVAPWLQLRFGTAPSMYANLTALAVVLAVIGVFTSSMITLAVAVIVAGAFIGINNTLTTQAVMLVSPVERPVASAAYGFVRFIGGGLAPYVAGRLAESFNVHVPFLIGAATFLMAIPILAFGHRQLADAERAQRGGMATPTAPAPVRELAAMPPARVGAATNGDRPLLLAVDVDSGSAGLTAAAAELARSLNCSVEVAHVRESEGAEGETVDAESLEDAQAAVTAHVAQLVEAGVPSSGEVLGSVTTHGAVGRLIAARAEQVGARAIVIGAPRNGRMAALADASAISALSRESDCDIMLLRPRSGPNGEN